MNDKYGVIIIGAGPAGLSCAIELSQKSNMSVLVVEKNNDIGPKICAGGLTTKIKELGIPLEIADLLFSSVSVFAMDEVAMKIDNKGAPFIGTIDRRKFGQFLLNKLSDRVTVLNGREVSRVEKNFIVVGQDKIKYKYLVGADGSASVVRNFLGLKNDKFLVAMHYLVPGEFKELELCFDTELFGSGYAWIFPHKNYASVGCGQDIRFSRRLALREGLERWLKRRNISVEDAKFESWMINFDYQGFDFGNIFLVGDAGGFASGFTGEGIYFGLISGREVARKIINPKYDCKEISEVLRIKDRHEKTLDFNSSLIRFSRPFSNQLFKFLLGLGRKKWVAGRLIRHYM